MSDTTTIDPMMAEFAQDPKLRAWMRVFELAPDLKGQRIGDDLEPEQVLLLTVLHPATRKRLTRGKNREAILMMCVRIIAHHDGDRGETLAYFADKAAFDNEDERLDQIEDFINTATVPDQDALGGCVEVDRNLDAILNCAECTDY